MTGSYVDSRTWNLEDYAEHLRSEIGTVIEREEIVAQHGPYWTPWNTEVTVDGIRHLVDGVADVNPLFRDRRYALRSRYGDIVAPPAFLYTVWYPTGTFMRRIPQGIKSFNSGGAMELFRPLLVGDRLSFKLVSPSRVEIKSGSRSSGKILLVYSDVEYYNQRGELVAIGQGYSIKAEAGSFEENARYGDREISSYTPAELADIYESQDAEVVRGETPLYWEDVEPGDALGPTVHGPASQFDNVAMFAGSGGYSLKADRIMRTSPYGWDFPMPPHPDTGGFANHEMIMIDGRIATARHGLPGPFVMGQHRMSQYPILLTNWMGDDGFLWRYSNQLRSLVFVGDTVWHTGDVVSKRIDGDRRVVEVSTTGTNQRGEVVSRGTASVLLPSRDDGPVRLPVPR